MTKSGLKRFAAPIVTVLGSTPKTINACVMVPGRVVAALRADSGKNLSIPVKASVQGESFKANVVRYRGAWRLYLNGIIRKAAAADVGDKVRVTLDFDPRSRVLPVPPALARALKANRRAQAGFAALSPSRRKELLRYLASLKRADSLKRNIERMLRYLTGRETGMSATGLYRVEKIKRRSKRKFPTK